MLAHWEILIDEFHTLARQDRSRLKITQNCQIFGGLPNLTTEGQLNDRFLTKFHFTEMQGTSCPTFVLKNTSLI